jgi:MFS family permease
MLDGMDVLVISYAAPAIADAWSISPANLGIVFSSGLTGMTVGAVFLAPLADRFGRKPLMVLAGLLMGVSVYLTSFSESLESLLIYRFISGLGVGVMMACTAVIASEYSPSKTRDFWVSLVVAGYPTGAVLTGIISVPILTDFGWQELFVRAGIASILIVPVLVFFLRESQEYKAQAQPKAAKLSTLFSTDYRLDTLQLWGALFLSFIALYFLISWIPKLAVNTGISLEASIYAGTIFNFGAMVGIPVQGAFSTRKGLKRTIGAIFLLTALLLIAFGWVTGDVLILGVLFLLGVGVQGGFVGLYAVAARMYPTEIRSTGLGWAIGIGRLGGIIGPIFGGFLVSLGLGMAGTFAVFAIPSLLAGWFTLKIKSSRIS